MRLIPVLVSIVLTASAVFGEERVKGGIFALPGEYPYVVSIAVQGNHSCGGFIYNNEWVITTASCVEKVLLFETQVVVAQLSLITEDVPFEKRYEVFSIVIYDQYNNVSKLHDLALIQVATPIVFSPNVTCMYYDETDILADNGEIMGWGATFDNATIPSTRMRKGVISNFTADCRDYVGFDRNYMICAGEPGTPDQPGDSVTPCHFDEGGPLVPDIPGLGKRAVGIFSTTKGCESGKPAVFTRLAPYYAWFEKYATKQPVNTCYDSTALP